MNNESDSLSPPDKEKQGEEESKIGVLSIVSTYMMYKITVICRDD